MFSTSARLLSLLTITMGSEAHPLHILFFPLMAAGHMLPTVDMAKLFASRGVKTTFITTPANAPVIKPALDRANHYPHPIDLRLLPFPTAAVGLPDGCESVSLLPSPELRDKFLKGVDMLHQPFDQVLTELQPDCIITDVFLTWTADAASEHGIPRLVFHGTSFFALCASEAVHLHKTLETLPPDAVSVVLPGLPHRIEMLRSQFREPQKTGPFAEILHRMKESVGRSYGVVVNSFYELEPDYAEHYRTVIGRKAWHIGPVSLSNSEADRGSTAAIDGGTCLNWLNGKTPGSVVYVCFGSLGEFTAAQLTSMAVGLQAAGHPFIWVVKTRSQGSEWMPEGYEERIEGRGLVIKGWAPQILILNHPAVGGFVTHCGWNSSLEGVSAGLPMVTWPLFAEQFYNERLIVDVLRIGVSVGVKEWARQPEERELVEAAVVEAAVRGLMGSGEEAEGRRRRAAELKGMARRALEEGGSSSMDMERLIEELMEKRVENKRESPSGGAR